MTAIAWIVTWGVVALATAVFAAVLASGKNRNASVWVAWCFLFPPLVLVLWLIPAREARAPRRRSRGEEDDDLEALDRLD